MCKILAQDDKIAVLVGTITDDVRLYEVPKMTVVALRVTETARARILAVRTPLCGALIGGACCQRQLLPAAPRVQQLENFTSPARRGACQGRRWWWWHLPCMCSARGMGRG